MKFIVTEKKYNKALKKAYRQGRQEGFDRGFRVAKALFEDFATDLKAEVEELNSEIILGQEDTDAGTTSEGEDNA